MRDVECRGDDVSGQGELGIGGANLRQRLTARHYAVARADSSRTGLEFRSRSVLVDVLRRSGGGGGVQVSSWQTGGSGVRQQVSLL